ncbi:hypothetical protein GGX14DRAFT_696336 [Mycena pura]|uniref:EF-hand domain-containing protein n=1 Tax=Mycena pura TaxID=153505 RepID=A0AAD6YFB1_9AGAR|nr:hypothetical protein GGX14DRAFT_696336 [Mycena pura]
MPQLLKKLSQRKRTKRTTSGSVTPHLVPAASDQQLSKAAPNGSAACLPHDKASPPTPRKSSGTLESGAVALNGTVCPQPANGNDIPQDDLSQDLREAWNLATTDPKPRKADKVLQTLENGMAGAMETQSNGVALVGEIKPSIEAMGVMNAIEKGIISLGEVMPDLIGALDELAKLHPYVCTCCRILSLQLLRFIQVAVLAFKAVWSLEQKRRSNDKKILSLHKDMKDMMEALIQLRDVKDVNKPDPNGSTIRGRMEVVIKSATKDIKDCGHACYTYSQKKLVVKVLKGPGWERKLASYAVTFTTRRSELKFALSIHTALQVDRLVGNVDEKIDAMMKMFAQFVTPDQKAMAQLVEQKGGSACLDDKALQELNDYENKATAPQRASATHGGKSVKPMDLDDLKDDLNTDPDTAMKESMTVFTRKFEVRQRQITDEVKRIVEREGDRVIGAVTAGPHDKIIDPHVHEIWKEMGWRGHVKARHFVMALRDHFQEEYKAKNVAERQTGPLPRPGIDTEDEWALEYIDVVRLQSILEAFDDDTSGFVTVAEANAFTKMRPSDWNLPRWIAYWAIGHHQAMQDYANKINELLAKMFAIVSHVKPENKSVVNHYLKTVYQGVYTLVDSLNVCYINSTLQEKFQSYIEAEEARIRGNLETTKYDIDSLDTLELITGDGRIDKYVLPVLYLLLERHLKIFHICRDHVIHPNELRDAADTTEYVFDAVNARLEVLRWLFKQQKLDLKQQFKSFSFGLYEYLNEPNLLWDDKIVQAAEHMEYTYDGSLEKQDIDVDKILNYPCDQDPLDFAAYELPVANKYSDGVDVLPLVAGLLSVPWHGFFWPRMQKYPSGGMLSLTFEPSYVQGDVQHFTGVGRAMRFDFKISGECRASDRPDQPGIVVLFTRKFLSHVPPTDYWIGTWDVATDAITGTLGNEKNRKTHPASFVFKRMPPEHMRFVPAPVELEHKQDKSRALWRFAIEAVRHQVRRDRWSWVFFKERRDTRRRFIELYIRGSGSSTFGVPLSNEECEEFNRILKLLTTADCRFYSSFAEVQIRKITNHDIKCDSCRGIIDGARLTCLVCQMKETFNTVDFHDSPSCKFTKLVLRDDMQKPHLPHHDLMKVRRVVHTRQYGKTYRDAKEALKNARAFFKTPKRVAADRNASDGDSDADTEDEGGHAPVSAKRLSQKLALAVPGSEDNLPRGLASNLMSPMPATPSPAPGSVSSGPLCCNSTCKEPITQPCWYCVQCGDAAFICLDCDAKGDVSFKGHDFKTHDLVRVRELVEEKVLTIEERLSKVEAAVDGRLAKVDGRLAKVEQLLKQLAGTT